MMSKPTLSRVQNEVFRLLDEAKIAKLVNGIWYPEDVGRHVMIMVEEFFTHFEWHPAKVVHFQKVLCAVIAAARASTLDDSTRAARAAREELGRDSA